MRTIHIEECSTLRKPQYQRKHIADSMVKVVEESFINTNINIFKF